MSDSGVDCGGVAVDTVDDVDHCDGRLHRGDHDARHRHGALLHVPLFPSVLLACLQILLMHRLSLSDSDSSRIPTGVVCVVIFAAPLPVTVRFNREYRPFRSFSFSVG